LWNSIYKFWSFCTMEYNASDFVLLIVHKVISCKYMLCIFLYVSGNWPILQTLPITWCFSDRASWIDSILITNLMHWLLFIHKILFSSTCFEPQVPIFRRIQLYTCSIWYCHSHKEWQYHMLHVYNCILLKMSTLGSKHVEENSILWINNNQCIKLVIDIYTNTFHLCIMYVSIWIAGKPSW